MLQTIALRGIYGTIISVIVSMGPKVSYGPYAMKVAVVLPVAGQRHFAVVGERIAE